MIKRTYQIKISWVWLLKPKSDLILEFILVLMSKGASKQGLPVELNAYEPHGFLQIPSIQVCSQRIPSQQFLQNGRGQR